MPVLLVAVGQRRTGLRSVLRAAGRRWKEARHLKVGEHGGTGARSCVALCCAVVWWIGRAWRGADRATMAAAVSGRGRVGYWDGPMRREREGKWQLGQGRGRRAQWAMAHGKRTDPREGRWRSESEKLGCLVASSSSGVATVHSRVGGAGGGGVAGHVKHH